MKITVLVISSANVKKSLTVNLFCVISDRTGTKTFASLYAGVSVAERIGLNGGIHLRNGLCTLADP